MRVEHFVKNCGPGQFEGIVGLEVDKYTFKTGSKKPCSPPLKFSMA
jgi:hypothetical protein